MDLKQFRVVYEYSDGRTKGAGACFVVAEDEAAARKVFARDMPNGVLKDLKLEHQDPLAQYERPALVEIARAENATAETFTAVPCCAACDELLVGKDERERGWCDRCEQDRPRGNGVVMLDEIDPRAR
jgi:hypothetical protein